MEHHHQQMVTHPNNFQTKDAKFIDIHWVFNDIHVFFVLFCLPTCPTFPPGSEQQQINLAWPYQEKKPRNVEGLSAGFYPGVGSRMLKPGTRVGTSKSEQAKQQANNEQLSEREIRASNNEQLSEELLSDGNPGYYKRRDNSGGNRRRRRRRPSGERRPARPEDPGHDHRWRHGPTSQPRR